MSHLPFLLGGLCAPILARVLTRWLPRNAAFGVTFVPVFAIAEIASNVAVGRSLTVTAFLVALIASAAGALVGYFLLSATSRTV